MSPVRDGVTRRGKTWSFVIRVTDDAGISRVRWVGGYLTEQAAKDARDAARVAARRGQYVDRSRITVCQYLAGWLDVHALEVKPRTRAGYANLIDSYVVPHIGSMRLQAVRPQTLSTLYGDLLAGGGRGGRPLSVRTVNYVHAILRKAFNDAVNSDQVLASNPALRAKRPRAEKGAGKVEEMWTAEQLGVFLEVMKDHRLFAMYRLAAFTGARRGELLHLRWADLTLDGDHPRLRIRGTAGMVDGVRVEGSTKSGEERTVSLDIETARILRVHREHQRGDEQFADGSWSAGDHVFRMQLGAPLFPDTPTQLMAKKISAYNDAREGQKPLPRIRFHDLRHVHATLLLKAGVPIHVVAKRLGHADPSITLRVYAHVLGEQASEAAQVFASLVDDVQDPVDKALVSKSVSKPAETGSADDATKTAPSNEGGSDLGRCP